MVHLGDICKINGAEIEPVWCITGGSPCQDYAEFGITKIYPSPGNAPVWREREAACLWSRYAS